jgi:hypothetical protein
MDEEISSLNKYVHIEKVPIYVLNTKTNVETKFSTIRECSKVMGIEHPALANRLKSGPNKVWPGHYRYRKEGGVFNKLTDEENLESIEKYRRSNNRNVLVKWFNTETVEEFPTVSDVKLRLNCDKGALVIWANNPDQLLYGTVAESFQIQFKATAVPWREIKRDEESFYNELEKTRKMQNIFVFDELWNISKETYKSGLECARAIKISRSDVAKLLNKKGEILFNGKRFMRELDYLRRSGKPDWLLV